MFDKKLFKKNAKEQLKNRYTIPCLCFFISMVMASILSLTKLMIKDKAVGFVFYIFTLLVSGILSYAAIYVCLKITKQKDPVSFSDFLDGLNFYKPAIFGTIWQNFILMLWALLVIIPFAIIYGIYFISFILKQTDISNLESYLTNLVNSGFEQFMLENISFALTSLFIFIAFVIVLFVVMIIKGIQYSFMSYILLENRDLTARKAMRISIEYTKGNKGNIFGFYFSFLGWILLACVPAFIFFIAAANLEMTETFKSAIGTVILSLSLPSLMPYYTTSIINAYSTLKEDAFASGKVKPENLTC